MHPNGKEWQISLVAVQAILAMQVLYHVQHANHTAMTQYTPCIVEYFSSVEDATIC